jgi:hypothetical protein
MYHSVFVIVLLYCNYSVTYYIHSKGYMSLVQSNTARFSRLPFGTGPHVANEGATMRSAELVDDS